MQGWWCISLFICQGSLYQQAIVHIEMAYWWPRDGGPHRWIMGRTVLLFHYMTVCHPLGWPFLWANHLKISFSPIITSIACFGSHQHEISGCVLKLQIRSFFVGAKALARNNINYWVCCDHLFTMQFGNPFLCHQKGFLYKHGDASYQGERQPLTSKNHQALQFKEWSRLHHSSHC